jgi:glycosyltransferase involved in cell wall biosynthesis
MPARRSADGTFLVALWCDLSLSTGYSINERESATALLDQFPDRIRVICPEPAHPEAFKDPRFDYVYNHRRHHPYHHALHTIAFRRKLKEIVNGELVSAIIFRLGPIPVVPALTIREGVPVILKTMKVPEPIMPRKRKWTQRLTALSSLPLYRYVAKNSIGGDVESHSYADWMQSRFSMSPAKLAVVPNGANTDVFRPYERGASRRKYGWEKFKYLIGYVGGIDSLRGVDVAVDAMSALRDVPDLGLVMVGQGLLVEEIRRRVSREGLEGRVILPGPVPYAEVPAVISAFDVAIDLTLVRTRIGNRTLYGSHSQKIPQYLACGVPVVAWETPDTAFLDENRVGRTAPVNDTSALTRLLRELALNGSVGWPDRTSIRQFACDSMSANAVARRRMKFWTELLTLQV